MKNNKLKMVLGFVTGAVLVGGLIYKHNRKQKKKTAINKLNLLERSAISSINNLLEEVQEMVAEDKFDSEIVSTEMESVRKFCETYNTNLERLSLEFPEIASIYNPIMLDVFFEDNTYSD